MPRPSRPRFHLAFPVRDLAATRAFYGDLLGCSEGRSAARWVDFDFFGHQISAHLVADEGVAGEGDADDAAVASNPVDGDDVPARHFGVILTWEGFDQLRRRLEEAGVDFLIGPRIRFAGEIGEQATMFIVDPSGNALELKAFKNPDQIFAR